MDGYVILGTKLDNNDLKKGIKDAENMLKQYDRNAEKLTKQKTSLEEKQTGLQEQINQYEQLTQKADEYHQQIRNLKASMNEMTSSAGGGIAPIFSEEYTAMADKLDVISLKEQEVVSQIDKLAPSVDKAYTAYDKNELKLQEINKELSDIDGKQKLVNSDIQKMNIQLAQSKGFESVKNSVNHLEKSMGNIVRRVGHWAIGIFGVYSAYSAVRGAMNIVSQYNTQIATDIEYMRYALAMSLEPVIIRLVQWAYKLLQYTAYILKAWFGIDLFANSSADKFNKAKQGVGGVASGLGKANKQAKELNKQLAGFDEMTVLSDNKSGGDSAGSGGGAGGVGGDVPSFDLSQMDYEVPKWLTWLGDHGDEIIAILAGIAGGLTAIRLGFSPLQSLGIGIAVAGIVYAIEALLKYLKDPSLQNMGKIITGIGIAIAGVAIAFGAWPIVLAGAVVAVVGLIISNWEKIKTFLQGGLDWLTGKSDWVHKMFGDTVGAIYDTIVAELQLVLNWFDKMITLIKKNFDAIISFVKNVFKGNWKGAWNDIKTIFKNIWEGVKTTFNTILSGIQTRVKGIAKATGSAISSVFKGVVNAVLRTIESVLNKPINTINTMIGIIKKLPGAGSIKTLPTFKLPRLAKGGIVNMPGNGVMVGNAIVGERGAEGVIPLTDSQQMQLLGEAIGRYITVNATITNSMNGRVLSREIKRIENNSDFALNR